MPGLDDLARRMRRCGAQVKRNTDSLVKAAARTANRKVVMATPVDSAQARANWRAGVGVPATEAINAKDRGGAATIARNNAEIAKRIPGQNVSIANNLTYVLRLDAGSSTQAPAGFAKRAADRAALEAGIKKVLE